jgi:hypothetical protein
MGHPGSGLKETHGDRRCNPFASGTSKLHVMPIHPVSQESLTREAIRRRSCGRYAAHPIEAALQHHRTRPPSAGTDGHAHDDFCAVEGIYRTGAQRVSLFESPLLAEILSALSRLTAVDRAGRAQIREWAAEQGVLMDESVFLESWKAQGRLHGAEHQVFYDPEKGRWFKRALHGLLWVEIEAAEEKQDASLP